MQQCELYAILLADLSSNVIHSASTSPQLDDEERAQAHISPPRKRTSKGWELRSDCEPETQSP